MRMSRGRSRGRPMRAPRGRPMRPTRARPMRASRGRPMRPARGRPSAQKPKTAPSRRGRFFNPMSRAMRRGRGRGMRRGRPMRKVPIPIIPEAPQMKNIIMDLDPPYTVAQPSRLVPRPGISFGPRPMPTPKLLM